MLNKYPVIGLYTNPKVLAVFFLGISSGLPLALVFSTLSIWLFEVGVSKTSIGLFSLVSLPYTVKFLWSPLVDNLPVPLLTKKFGRRRSWMLLTQFLIILFLILLGYNDPYENLFLTALFAFMVSLFSATQDIVIDAYRVEILDEEQQGRGAAMNVNGYRIGMLISSAGALLVAEYNGWFVSYICMAICMIIGVITALSIKESSINSIISGDSLGFWGWFKRILCSPFSSFNQANRSEKLLLTSIFLMFSYVCYLIYNKLDLSSLYVFSTISIFVSFILSFWFYVGVKNPFSVFMVKKGWYIILIFLVLFKLGDAFVGVMTGTFLRDIGFSKEEIAYVVKTFGFIASIAGAFVGAWVVDKVGLIKALWVAGILQMFSNLIFVIQANLGYNIPMLAITIAVENFCAGLGTAAFVAYISLLCNKEYSLTQYALFSSLAAIGRTFLSASSGWFVDSIGWINFFLLSTVIAIPGLMMLLILRRFEQKEVQKDIALQKNPTKNCSSA